MKFQQPVHIVAAKRSPIGRFGGTLLPLSAADIAVQVGESLLAEVAPFSRGSIDSAIFGHVLQSGTGMNLARQVALRLELGEQTPAYSVNIVCGSGLQSVGLAAREIASGESNVVLAGGAESMSNAPFLAGNARWGGKFGDGVLRDTIISEGLKDPLLEILMGETAERVAEKFDISREEQDHFSLRSQEKVAAAQDKFKREIATIQVPKGSLEYDEHVRADTTLEKLARLKPAFRPDGGVTAGNASGLNDGAAALLVASEKAVLEHGFVSRARIAGTCVVGCEPALMGLGPVGAVQKLCKELDWDLASVEAIELNEAFAAQSIGCVKQLGLRDEQVNQRGGSIALGHPIGASGARVLVTLLHLMEDEGLKRGIAALCIGGGMGIALAIEI